MRTARLTGGKCGPKWLLASSQWLLAGSQVLVYSLAVQRFGAEKASIPLKVLQISSAQSMGGGERHLADLANGLAERGHEVYLALRPNSPLVGDLNTGNNQNVTTLALRNSLDAISARQLSKLVRTNEIQIVHAHMARDYPLAAYAVRQNKAARLIVTRHVLFPLNPLHRVTLAGASRVIAVSQAVAAQLGSDHVAPPEKISVVLNGIDSTRFAKARQKFDRESFLREWQLPRDSLLVGTVGELTPLKGQAEFVQAAAKVLARHPKSYFFIAGIDHTQGEKNRIALERLIEDLNLRGRVKLVGWSKDLAQLYCAFDVFVSASHTESFGLALAEAMACSTAIVATETEGAREIVQGGQTGLLVPLIDPDKLTDAIVELLNDQGRRSHLGRAAQQSVATRFSVERMIDETEEIYRAEI